MNGFVPEVREGEDGDSLGWSADIARTIQTADQVIVQNRRRKALEAVSTVCSWPEAGLTRGADRNVPKSL